MDYYRALPLGGSTPIKRRPDRSPRDWHRGDHAAPFVQPHVQPLDQWPVLAAGLAPGLCLAPRRYVSGPGWVAGRGMALRPWGCEGPDALHRHKNLLNKAPISIFHRILD